MPTKNIIIVGSGAGVWEELAEAQNMMPVHHIMAVNFAMFGLETLNRNSIDRTQGQPYVNHWASLTPEYFAFKPRHAVGVTTHCSKPGIHIDYVHSDLKSQGGSGGEWAIHVALKIGYKKIIVCGIPIDHRARFYDAPGSIQYYGSGAARYAWIQNKNSGLFENVRSMSGWTAELLGKPTVEWINS
jgi:hypothetical protein